MPNPQTEPYDALLLVSFGGPEAPEDVVPFLENVTRGRGIPRERLVEVGAHYAHFAGVSPINELNRQLVASVRAELDRRGESLPVLWGNRNWGPYLLDALRYSKCEKMVLEINGPLSPVKLLPEDGKDFIYLVLPVRFKNEG